MIPHDRSSAHGQQRWIAIELLRWLSDLVTMWLFKRVSNRPSSMEAVLCSTVWNIQKFAPLGKTSRFIAIWKHPCLPAVSGLRSATCPSTILRRIWAVIVNAVNFSIDEIRWSHVGREVFKSSATKPSIAHEDSATAIVMVRFIRFAFTPANHCCPYFVKFSMRLPVCMPLGCKFSLQASAAFTASWAIRKEVVGLDALDGSAVTLASPVSVRHVIKDSPSAKSHTSQLVCA